MPELIAFDLHGTLIHVQHPVEYEDAASLRARSWPDQDACALVRHFIDLGHRIAFLTAAPATVGRVLRDQLESVHLPTTHLITRPTTAWKGWAWYETWKARELRRLRAKTYVGDLDGANGRRTSDLRAARAADAVFIPAPTWRELSLSLRVRANSRASTVAKEITRTGTTAPACEAGAERVTARRGNPTRNEALA